MKMDAHQEKMIGWTLFIVGYFPTWVLNKRITSTILLYNYLSLSLSLSSKKNLILYRKALSSGVCSILRT